MPKGPNGFEYAIQTHLQIQSYQHTGEILVDCDDFAGHLKRFQLNNFSTVYFIDFTDVASKKWPLLKHYFLEEFKHSIHLFHLQLPSNLLREWLP